jgi:hypothetical protein
MDGFYLHVSDCCFPGYTKKGSLPSIAISKKLFIVMAVTVAPNYLLSILWL